MRSTLSGWCANHFAMWCCAGTGKAARIQGLSIFGKTGTAQKLDPVTGTYSDRAWVVSFVCGAPAEDPEALVLVMVDEPTAPGIHYGGTVAAPVASGILQSTMQRLAAMKGQEITAAPDGNRAH
jgi:cell division protein FtsI (penicillin-binding protein 3)